MLCRIGNSLSIELLDIRNGREIVLYAPTPYKLRSARAGVFGAASHVVVAVCSPTGTESAPGVAAASFSHTKVSSHFRLCHLLLMLLCGVQENLAIFIHGPALADVPSRGARCLRVCLCVNWFNVLFIVSSQAGTPFRIDKAAS